MSWTRNETRPAGLWNYDGIGVLEMDNKKSVFVIMPFSSTKTCTEAEWEHIFNTVFKPAAEACGYSCEKVAPSRGSLIKSIIEKLYFIYSTLSLDSVWNELNRRNLRIAQYMTNSKYSQILALDWFDKDYLYTNLAESCELPDSDLLRIMMTLSCVLTNAVLLIRSGI